MTMSIMPIDLIEAGKRFAKYAHWYPFGQGIAAVAIDLYRPGRSSDELWATRQALATLVQKISWREKLLFIPMGQKSLVGPPGFPFSRDRIDLLLRSIEATVLHHRKGLDESFTGTGMILRDRFQSGIEWGCDAIERMFDIAKHPEVPRFPERIKSPEELLQNQVRDIIYDLTKRCTAELSGVKIAEGSEEWSGGLLCAAAIAISLRQHQVSWTDPWSTFVPVSIAEYLAALDAVLWVEKTQKQLQDESRVLLMRLETTVTGAIANGMDPHTAAIKSLTNGHLDPSSPLFDSAVSVVKYGVPLAWERLSVLPGALLQPPKGWTGNSEKITR